jgi:hypothetical protein
MKDLKTMKLSEALPYLEEIAAHFSLRLHYVQEFRLAWKIFANRHYNAPWEADG